MSRLALAAERLTNALNALDAALVPLKAERDAARDAVRAARAEADDARARLAGAGSERESLLARIAELEEDQQALNEISEQVETRLDGAIAEIRTALGR
jgi:chromosome segregation ATPase